MRFPRFVPLYVALTLSTVHLLAQSPDGNINGLVSDPSSAAVVGAEVVAVNDVTGVQYTTRTNSEGIYVLPSLPPGPYRLQISKVGFKTIIKPDIVLNVQDALSVNFTLPIGAAYEVLTVEGGAALVNTESAAVSTVVDQTYVKNMPLNGRSFQDLILLTPGVVTQSPQSGATLGQSGEFSVNGQRTESNNYTVDGVSGNVGATTGLGMPFYGGASGSLAASTALGTTQALVSVDALQEFRVQSSSYSAEFGRNPGGQFAFTTKSGTNQWHGTAYDYLRNGALDAQDWFNNYFGKPEPALRQNDFGGTFGGPVGIPHLLNGKDRTFFFISYEGLRLISPQAASINYVPDAFLRTNTPPALQQALTAFPAPNGPDDTANGIAQFIGSWSNPSSLDSTSARFDHVFGDKLRLFFRFSDTTSESAIRGMSGTAPTVNQKSTYSMRTYTAAADSAFSNRISNQIRLNYSSNVARNINVIDGFGGSTPADLLQLSGLDSESGAAFALVYNGYNLGLTQQQPSGAQRQWNLVDTVSLSLGQHLLKFGVDYRRLTPFGVPPTPSVEYAFESENAVLTNSPFMYVQTSGLAYPLYTNFAAFAQDDWRVSQRLRLSLGLRWEVNPAPGVTQGLKPYTVQGSSPNTWAVAPEGTPLWQTAWFNFAPRLGVVYAARNEPNWQTVVRVGGGVFFDTGQQLGSLGFVDAPGFTATVYPSGTFPINAASLAPAIENPPSAPYSEVPVGFSSHLQSPYTLEWNAAVEQGLSKSQSVTFSYVGSHAARLLKENLFFTPNNPNMFAFYSVANGLTSDYGSFQAQFRRKLNQGLTALASYTWSHCIDYGSQNLSLGYERGNCDFDVRNNLSGALSYDLPDVGVSGLAKFVLHGWGLDDRVTARTAFPVSLAGNELIDPAGHFYFSGLDLVAGQPVYLYGASCASVLQGLGDLSPGQGCPGGRAINPQAFTNVTSGFGTAARNFARGFGAWQMDLAVRRNFPIYERLQLQFRAEAFNVFNHPNFGTVNPNFGESTFGQATGTLASSLGVLNPLYQMGGPRSMQFALKLIF